MSLQEHAKRELELAGLFKKDSDYDGMLAESVMQLIKVFSKQGHSGGSASLVIQLFKDLANYKTISPITGTDSEWNEVGHGVFQNNRLSTVFKQSDRFDGKPYDIDGRIFSDDGGKTWFSNKDSFKVIEFPYTQQKPERIILK